MRNVRATHRRFTFPAITAVSTCSLALTSCGSSGNTITAPSTLSKCAVTVDVPVTTIPSAGGGGYDRRPDRARVPVDGSAGSHLGEHHCRLIGSGLRRGPVHRRSECGSASRSAGVMVNGQRAQVSQAAGECRFELSSNATSLPKSGGTGSVDVRASSALCTWTAASDTPWISISSNANGKGSAAVTFTVASTTGPPRVGTLTIAGQHFSVTQSEGCSYAIAPASQSVGASGGTQSVAITSSAGCPWTAASNADWISVGPRGDLEQEA